jgi:ornithine cyclodeaminase/alanine dehydrogenase
MHLPGRAGFHAMPGALDEPPLAAVKWVGLAADNAARGLPHLFGIVILSDAGTGQPVAILDGTWITAARTAAVTAVAAKRLAREGSASIGFVACGVQAESHLTALRSLFPIKRIVACGHRRTTSEKFAAAARAGGLEAVVTDQPRDAVHGMDIVITSVPASPGFTSFLDPDWLSPGSFASAVDLGRSWLADKLRGCDRLVTDDHAQSRVVAAAGLLGWSGAYDADLGEIVTGTKPGRLSPHERIMFIHPGIALADVAVAAEVVAEARRKGIGTMLAL